MKLEIWANDKEQYSVFTENDDRDVFEAHDPTACIATWNGAWSVEPDVPVAVLEGIRGLIPDGPPLWQWHRVLLQRLPPAEREWRRRLNLELFPMLGKSDSEAKQEAIAALVEQDHWWAILEDKDRAVLDAWTNALKRK
jgi:hypothetical protein